MLRNGISSYKLILKTNFFFNFCSKLETKNQNTDAASTTKLNARPSGNYNLPIEKQKNFFWIIMNNMIVNMNITRKLFARKDIVYKLKMFECDLNETCSSINWQNKTILTAKRHPNTIWLLFFSLFLFLF